MPDAIQVVRCMKCGGAMTSSPDFAPRADRWIACDSRTCPDQGKRYALPKIALEPYRGKGAKAD